MWPPQTAAARNAPVAISSHYCHSEKSQILQVMSARQAYLLFSALLSTVTCSEATLSLSPYKTARRLRKHGASLSGQRSLDFLVFTDRRGENAQSRCKFVQTVVCLCHARSFSRRVVSVSAGWLSDVSGSYDLAFCAAGVTIFLSGLMLFFAPCIGRVQSGERRFSDGFDARDCCCVAD